MDTENSSGSGELAIVPAEVDKWNWGAFFLNWIWGIGNRTYIAFLMFVPLVNVAMPFVLGAKGSSWAWKNKRWESVDAFKATQRKWALWSGIIAISVVIAVIGLGFVALKAIRDSEAFKLAEAKASKSVAVQQILGAPISTGVPVGVIQTSPSGGFAVGGFAIDGPKGKGVIQYRAVQLGGAWQLKSLVLARAEGRPVDLTKEE